MQCTACGAGNAEGVLRCQRCGQLLGSEPELPSPPPGETTERAESPAAKETLGPDKALAGASQPLSPGPVGERSSASAGVGSQSHSSQPSRTFTTIGGQAEQRRQGPSSLSREWPLRTMVANGILPLRRDQASLVMLLGCGIGMLGFFLPWIQMNNFYPLLPSQFSINGPDFGLVTWLLLLLLLLQAGLAGGEAWFLKNNPRLVIWLPAFPLIIGSFGLAIAVYTLGIGLRLEGLLDLVRSLARSMSTEAGPNIGIGLGTYLTLLGSLIVLGSGAYRLARLLLQARFPQ